MTNSRKERFFVVPPQNDRVGVEWKNGECGGKVTVIVILSPSTALRVNYGSEGS